MAEMIFCGKCWFDQEYILIEYTQIPSMCPEFDPNPNQVDTTVFYTNLKEEKIKEITDPKKLRELYKLVVGKRERITVWRAIKELDGTNYQDKQRKVG